jgi:GT2 family glycosyltransferase
MKIYAGFITYGESTAKYLADFLPSLRLALQDSGTDSWKILAVDNSQDDDNPNRPYLDKEQAAGNFDYLASKANLGFGKAYNLMLRQALDEGADYFLIINPDTVLDSELVARLANGLNSNNCLGATCPRILSWDFASKVRTNTIDSDGITVTAALRFLDSNQGKAVFPEKAKLVFGFSGACALLRLSVLKDIAFDNGRYLEYFDELFFMYKEDIDLSYRLCLAGWEIGLEPSALLWHDRSVRQVGKGLLGVWRNRGNKSRQVKRWSFLNHWILVIKFWYSGLPWKVKFKTAVYQAIGLVFALLREPYLLSELGTLWQLLPQIKAKRSRLVIKEGINVIEKFI